MGKGGGTEVCIGDEEALTTGREEILVRSDCPIYTEKGGGKPGMMPSPNTQR
jgi:hypothetical protein